jgi:hypothetical protein
MCLDKLLTSLFRLKFISSTRFAPQHAIIWSDYTGWRIEEPKRVRPINFRLKIDVKQLVKAHIRKLHTVKVTLKLVKYKFLTAVKMNTATLFQVMPCSLVD